MASLCLCCQLIFSEDHTGKIFSNFCGKTKGNHFAGCALDGAVCTNEIEDRSSQGPVVAFTECSWCWCWGYMAGVLCMSTVHEQPLNWENQSSSCRGDLGHSCRKAGRRGRTHAWSWVGAGSVVEFLIMFLASARKLQLLEELRQEQKEILARCGLGLV